MATNFERKNKSKNLLIFVSLILSVVALLSATFGIFGNKGEDANKVSRFDWVLGTINESGKTVDSKQNIITEAFYELRGAEISIVKDAIITYKVAFYNEDKDFISFTESLNEDFDATTIPESAVYFRVVITPCEVDGEAVKISAFNIRKYTKQLEIILAK